MAKHLIREFVDGKMVGHEVEAESKEEALKKFQDEVVPALGLERAQEKADRIAEAERSMRSDPRIPPRMDPALDGKRFGGIEFRCGVCKSPLTAEFLGGYLEVSHCPKCLAKMDAILGAVKTFEEV